VFGPVHEGSVRYQIAVQPCELGLWVLLLQVTFLLHKEKEAKGLLQGQGSHPSEVTLPYLCCHRILESGKGLLVCNFTCVHTTYAHFSLRGSLKRAISFPGFLKVIISQFMLAQAKICLPFAFHSSDGLHCLQFTYSNRPYLFINHCSVNVCVIPAPFFEADSTYDSACY